jgi:starch phosphorylase
MEPLYVYNVVPNLPPKLEPLRELVYNLWWTWEPSARKLFRHLDPALWDKTNHNPVRMLQLAKQSRLLEVAGDDDFLRELGTVHAEFKAYLNRKDTWWNTREEKSLKGPIAYFSAEFGFHESVPNYSGGLGILAGDHVKSASDLGLNFVAVTLLYRHGYFRQQINKEGWQESQSLNQNFHHLPIREVLDGSGKPLAVVVDLPDRPVRAKVWELAVGRVKLILLDTDIPENHPDDRLITAHLYGGDHEMRIRQEIVLGIGGIHALSATGVHPEVYHMNEGHSAFLSLELIERTVREKKIDFYSAVQVVASGNVFTTHTPVPAGNDAFPRDLMARYFGKYPHKVGISFEELFRFGQESDHSNPTFSMTILALRTSRHSNGVSALHGLVSQGLWRNVWSGVPKNEVPITSITNGIHTKTWLAPEISALYNRYLGPDWEEHLTDADFWFRVIEIPDEELWKTHLFLKNRLINVVRDRLGRQRERLGESPAKVRQAARALDPDVLTIGFARRFATYKRATLLFADIERLRRIVENRDRPVQFVFAGKAHPKDDGGKRFIQEVYKLSRDPRFENRIVFVEDYDTYIARRLVQGVDLWLNNPLRPLEASGTSGMKSPPNGGLNLSVLDGWWCEGYNGKNGWAIGADLTDIDASTELQTEVDTASLFHLLETQIVPLYYAKPDGRLPVAWIQLMRESMRTLTPVFNTHRMVKEYCERVYTRAARGRAALDGPDCALAAELSRWKTQIRKDWPNIRIAEVKMENAVRSTVSVGEDLRIAARVHLGPVDPNHVRVQVYFGPTDNSSIDSPTVIDLPRSERLDAGGDYLYRGSIPSAESGAYGFNVRVIPSHKGLLQGHELRLITWAK